MATRTVPGRHVRQVAELVCRLNQDEIRQLIRLAPQLQAKRKATTDKQYDLVQWARKQMSRHVDQAHPMQDEDAFLDDTTVEAYFALPDARRKRIWDELYATAIEAVQEREVKPDAVIPAR